MRWQQLDSAETRWFGQHVVRLEAPLSHLQNLLPTFSREGFMREHVLNEYLDVIVRNPTADDDRAVPIGTVSKKYALIQHQDAVQCVVTAFESANWRCSTAATQVWMSDYGERVRLAVSLPCDNVDPGDGHPLHAEVLVWNSVDRSRAFEIAIRWKRLICRNGLTIFNEDRLKKIHNVDWMSAGSPAQFITDRLPKSRNRVLDLGRWLEVRLEVEQVMQWADKDLASRWGHTRAARLIHILETGRDCAVGRRRANQALNEITVESLSTVPGIIAPGRNAYDAFQALLWIANNEQSIEKQETLLATVIDLMQRLLQEAGEALQPPRQ